MWIIFPEVQNLISETPFPQFGRLAQVNLEIFINRNKTLRITSGTTADQIVDKLTTK